MANTAVDQVTLPPSNFILALFGIQIRDQIRQALANRRTKTPARPGHTTVDKSATPAHQLAEMAQKAQRELFQWMQEARKKQII